MTTAPFLTPAEDARRVRRVLPGPLTLGPGEELIDLDLIVPADFARTGPTHAVTMHPAGNRIRNVRILFETDAWLDRWALPLGDQPERGINSHVSGLCLAGTTGADVDGLHVEGAPRIGIEGWDVAGLRLRRFSATRCLYGAHLSRRAIGNSRLDVSDVRVWDLWGPPGGYPSRVRPGGWIGADGWVSNGSKVRLRRLDLSGELYCGAKICDGTFVVVEKMTTPSLMFQARGGPKVTAEDARSLTWLSVRSLYLNAATGTGAIADVGNKLQISWGVVGQFQGGYIIGNGRDGNAVQVTGDCHVEMRGLTIGGFNGVRGSLPACALELDVRDPVSTINADFETANHFEKQRLLVRRAA